jgi:predicted nucleic acid-binding protein
MRRSGLRSTTLSWSRSWLYELQNGLAMLWRSVESGSTRPANEALEALRGLRVDTTAPRGLGQEFRLAHVHGLTAYHAAYLAVAPRENSGLHFFPELEARVRGAAA